MTHDENTNRRREAAEAAVELRDSMREILATPADYDDEIDAKRHAANALSGIEDAEEALRLWRDTEEEEGIELLGEEPRSDGGGGHSGGDMVMDCETARMVLARMHVVDALPPCDASHRSVANIADSIDRDEEYVRGELERLAEWGVAEIVEDGARLAHQRVVVELLVSDKG